MAPVNSLFAVKNTSMLMLFLIIIVQDSEKSTYFFCSMLKNIDKSSVLAYSYAIESKIRVHMTAGKSAFVRFITFGTAALFFMLFSSSALSQDDAPESVSHHYQLPSPAELAMHAMSIIDTDYKFGGNGRADGFDCSGLVRYVFKAVWNTELPRTSAEMSQVGRKINVADLRSGDLVFYNTRKRRYSHVGIYLGDNKFVHAPSRGGKVRVEDMGGKYWQVRFNGARRIDSPQKERLAQELSKRPHRADTRPRRAARSR